VFVISVAPPCTCQYVATQKVVCDSRCLSAGTDQWGGLGCNAGGQGQICRFCGFAHFPPCP